jgi:hypothetical protein
MRTGQFKALVLLVALLGGGFALPLYDAVAFHSTPGPAKPETGVLAAPGTDVGHAQVCAISHARTPAGLGPAVPTALADPFLQKIRPRVHVVPIVLEQSTPYEHLSRAPPILA